MSRTDTVVVGCKLPHGLTLQLRDEHQQVIAERTLKGVMTDVKPFILQDSVSYNTIDEEFWMAWQDWAEKNKFAPFINGYVFAHSTAASVKAEAKEKAKHFTGQERLRPEDKTDTRLAEFRKAGLKKLNHKDNEDEE
jgi:hypothetical protein